MQVAVERNNNSLFVLGVDGDTICYLPNILAKDNQRTILKTLGLFFKHFKNEVKNEPGRVVKQD